MPEQSLYCRGRYRLERDNRSPYYQIVWYDRSARRNRSKSTGTASLGDAEQALDALYQQRERGRSICPTCGQLMPDRAPLLVTSAIADYLVARDSRPTIDTIKARLKHVNTYLEQTDQLALTCDQVDEEWVEGFRRWALTVPVGKSGKRALGTVEGSVRQLAAVINSAHAREDVHRPAAFKPKKPSEVSATPAHRSDIKELARMFAYCLAGKNDKERAERANLHRFLQISVATWARPDAAHDVSQDQWHRQSRTLALNPKGRAQTRKYRPIVPVAHQMVPLLNANKGFYVKVKSVRKAFEAMARELKLPRNRESGMKLIRRSVANIARKRLGERDWIEGRIMLGHHRPTTSDTYAPFDAGYLSRALEVTEGIIDDIIAIVPEAFHRTFTGESKSRKPTK